MGSDDRPLRVTEPEQAILIEHVVKRSASEARMSSERLRIKWQWRMSAREAGASRDGQLGEHPATDGAGHRDSSLTRAASRRA